MRVPSAQQLAMGAVANLGTVASGMTLGFSAVALPAMQAPGHMPYVSDAQASWIGECLHASGLPHTGTTLPDASLILKHLFARQSVACVA
jgi:hypothetical protein